MEEAGFASVFDACETSGRVKLDDQAVETLALEGMDYGNTMYLYMIGISRAGTIHFLQLSPTCAKQCPQAVSEPAGWNPAKVVYA